MCVFDFAPECLLTVVSKGVHLGPSEFVTELSRIGNNATVFVCIVVLVWILAGDQSRASGSDVLLWTLRGSSCDLRFHFEAHVCCRPRALVFGDLWEGALLEKLWYKQKHVNPMQYCLIVLVCWRSREAEAAAANTLLHCAKIRNFV